MARPTKKTAAVKKADPAPAAKKPQAAPKAPAVKGPIVCLDRQRHTCIELSRQDGTVKFIPLSIEGLEVQEMSAERFDKIWSPRIDYPADRAAKLYAGYAADLGGSLEAMQALATIIPLSQPEISMATTKKKAAEAAKPAAKKTAAPKADTKAAAKKTAAPKAAKESTGERKPSAAQMFKDLIMEGKKTDDQIFAAVQKAFNLDDNKRGYVKWYRNDLTKKGLNPPAAKG